MSVLPEDLLACESRRIEVDGGAGPVAGLLWTPTAIPPPWPLVLVGHGGGGPHKGKDEPRNQQLTRRWCTNVGAAALMIDGPAHGERTPEGDNRVDVIRRIRAILGAPETPPMMAADWKAALAEARSIDGVATDGPAGYAGFSMGTLLGVPSVAAIPEITAAVFGLGGVPAVGGMEKLALALGSTPEQAAEAEKLESPQVRGAALLDGARNLGDRQVLLLNMLDDEMFPVAGVWEFFNAVSTPHKRIAFYPGGHVQLPSEAMHLGVWWMRRHLHGIEGGELPSGAY